MSLPLADERVLIFRLGLKDDEGEPLGTEQQETDKALRGFLEISPFLSFLAGPNSELSASDQAALRNAVIEKIAQQAQ